MSVHRSENWHEQSRMGTFLRTGPRLHETSSSIISDRSKVVNFAGSWRYLTPLFSLSLSLHVQRDPDVSIFASLPLGKPPRLVEIRDRFARGTKDGRAHLCRFPFTFYRWKEFIVYR